jgi:RNA polymerase sigma-70 factor, ECF subfamily
VSLGDRFPETLAAAAEGADWAWAALYRDLAPVLLRFLTSMGAAEPEDALAECFLQLVRNLPRFDGDEAAFRAWAFQVARHRVYDTWRAAGRRPNAPTGNVQALHERAFQHEPADAKAIEAAAVEEILGRLTRDQRAVLTLRVLDRFSVEETAQILGRSPGAIRVLQHRAVKVLRRNTLPPSDRHGDTSEHDLAIEDE